MRKIAALGVDDVEKEYAFAKCIVEGLPVENVNCEGCVLFGNVECSRLCATRREVYNEFVSEVLDNLVKGIDHGKANFWASLQYRNGKVDH